LRTNRTRQKSNTSYSGVGLGREDLRTNRTRQKSNTSYSGVGLGREDLRTNRTRQKADTSYSGVGLGREYVRSNRTKQKADVFDTNTFNNALVILGFKPNNLPNKKDIIKSYRNKIRKFHSDKCNNNIDKSNIRQLDACNKLGILVNSAKSYLDKFRNDYENYLKHPYGRRPTWFYGNTITNVNDISTENEIITMKTLGLL
jgi:hypothetical protein